MKFTKMQGLGNDYVYVNGFEERIENPSEMAVKVSNRNFGVGSDGLILINPSEKADFEMEMYNADGSFCHATGEIADRYRIANANRFFEQDDQARDKVGENFLQTKTETNTERGNQPLQFRPLNTNH